MNQRLKNASGPRTFTEFTGTKAKRAAASLPGGETCLHTCIHTLSGFLKVPQSTKENSYSLSRRMADPSTTFSSSFPFLSGGEPPPPPPPPLPPPRPCACASSSITPLSAISPLTISRSHSGAAAVTTRALSSFFPSISLSFPPLPFFLFIHLVPSPPPPPPPPPLRLCIAAAERGERVQPTTPIKRQALNVNTDENKILTPQCCSSPLLCVLSAVSSQTEAPSCAECRPQGCNPSKPKAKPEVIQGHGQGNDPVP